MIELLPLLCLSNPSFRSKLSQEKIVGAFLFAGIKPNQIKYLQFVMLHFSNSLVTMFICIV